MKTLLILILLLFAAPAIAQTGIFYDATVRGEGVTVYGTGGVRRLQNLLLLHLWS